MNEKYTNNFCSFSIGLRTNKKFSQVFAHLDGGMDCVTALYAGVAVSSSTEKEQEFGRFSFVHNPPYLYLRILRTVRNLTFNFLF